MKKIIDKLFQSVELKELLNFFFIIIILFLSALMTISILGVKNGKQIKEKERNNYYSYKIANELKESSEGLTKYLRSYVITGDSIWVQKYNEILEIRKGLRARENGRFISLNDSIKKMDFSEAEIHQLILAEKNSNNLVHTELTALNAMKGMYEDKNGNFTIKREPNQEFAISILFDDKYHSDKGIIMEPINVFFELLNIRNENEILHLIKLGNFYKISIVIMVLLIAFFSFISFIFIRNKIILTGEKLKKINNQLISVKDDLVNHQILLEKKIDERTKELKIALDKEKELGEAKTRFVTMASHEFRTPLTSINSATDIILRYSEKLNKSDIEKRLHKIKSEVADMTKTLEDFLIIGKSYANKLKFHAKETNIINLVQDIINGFMFNLDEKREIEIDFVVDEILLMVDEKWIKIIVNNLISNAIKFSEPPSKIKVKISKEKNCIVLTVSDLGIGISKKDQNNIFEPFHRGENAEIIEGTGLGMSIVKKAVELHNGTIEVLSELNKGTEVKISFKSL
jgi:signal transduction histidine kinase